MKIQTVRGTHDIFDQDLFKYNQIRNLINQYAKIYNFEEIITPIFETTDLFKKPLGELSDVVLKEMYTFQDKNESLLTLRPELTTPILRASMSNSLLNKLPQKLYGMGPVFRRERPQKGRYRQFNQINFEILGTHDTLSDAELIFLANDIINDLLPNKDIKLQINSLGDSDTLKIFKKELTNFYKLNINKLSEDSKIKIDSNPIRILDSKNIIDVEVNLLSPKISDFYSNNAIDNFVNIQKLLTENLIEYSINHELVRGLDYYCHTVFEFKTNQMGNQNTIIGGGRYDGLVKILGGPDIPGVGWAGGVERFIMLMDSENNKNKCVHIVIMNEKFKNYGSKIAYELRKHKIPTYFNYKYNLKKSLSQANELDDEYAIIIGEEEVKSDLLTIKNLYKNTQDKISIKEIIKILI